MTRTFKRKFVSIITVIAMLMVTVPFGAIATDVLGESIGLIEIPLAPSNMTISKEVAMFDSVIDNLWTARETLYDNPAVVGAPYVPAGATCLEVYSVGNVVYVNYVMNNTYYYTTYYKNTGEVEKVARVKNSDDIYSVSSTNVVTSRVGNVESSRAIYYLSSDGEERNLVKASEYIMESGGLELMAANNTIPITIGSLYSAVVPGENTLDSDYVYVPEVMDLEGFTGTTADAYLYYRVFQAAIEFDGTESYQDFAVGTSASTIASYFGASVYYIRSLLSGILSSSDTITSPCSIHESTSMSFEAYLVCLILTPITNIMSEWQTDSGTGILMFGWSDSSGTGLGYNEANWSSYCPLFNVSDSTILSDGVSAFVDNITAWGSDSVVLEYNSARYYANI